MSTVLEEVTQPEITRDHVLRRVADWKARVDAIYKMIESWLPSGWTVERARHTQMHEELMKNAGVPAHQLPILDLLSNGQIAASIEPRGLWIIGANGRLDLTRADQRYLIIDAAQNFDPPQWEVADFSNRGEREPLNQQKFLSLL